VLIARLRSDCLGRPLAAGVSRRAVKIVGDQSAGDLAIFGKMEANVGKAIFAELEQPFAKLRKDAYQGSYVDRLAAIAIVRGDPQDRVAVMVVGGLDLEGLEAEPASLVLHNLADGRYDLGIGRIAMFHRFANNTKGQSMGIRNRQFSHGLPVRDAQNVGLGSRRRESERRT
jgi:hypothetical protein